MATHKEVALISLASGSLTLASYLIIQKYFLNKKPIVEASRIYEEKALLDQYMMFNFATPEQFILFNDLNEHENVRNCVLFPKRVALLCRDHCPDIFFNENQSGERSALDVGCAVGRSCFELSKLFQRVVGIDYSSSFINMCNQITTLNGEVDYQGQLEGDLSQNLRVRLDSDVNLDRISFEVGDACHLRPDLGEFDLVLASNLICRLVEPKRFLSRLKTLVKSKKYAILSTPFTWGTAYTPKVQLIFFSNLKLLGLTLIVFKGKLVRRLRQQKWKRDQWHRRPQGRARGHIQFGHAAKCSYDDKGNEEKVSVHSLFGYCLAKEILIDAYFILAFS
jgi:SAM-dependent methyltransferase